LPEPLEASEWARVTEITLAIVNAALADDEALARAKYLELEEYSSGLLAKYGDHPVLLETLADFCPDVVEQLELYRRASEEASARKLPLHTIHISWAGVLIEDAGRPEEALHVLEMCSRDVDLHAEDGERVEYDRLVVAAKRARSEPPW
jgi:hypothetical protein